MAQIILTTCFSFFSIFCRISAVILSYPPGFPIFSLLINALQFFHHFHRLILYQVQSFKRAAYWEILVRVALSIRSVQLLVGFLKHFLYLSISNTLFIYHCFIFLVYPNCLPNFLCVSFHFLFFLTPLLLFVVSKICPII